MMLDDRMRKQPYSYTPIIKSFEFWTESEEGRGFHSAWQLGLLTKALYLDGLKTASFFRESGVPLSLCVFEGEYRSSARQRLWLAGQPIPRMHLGFK